MPPTWFATFLAAVEETEVRDGILGDDGLVYPPRDEYYGYEATPRNALTFGAMGVDGVHYVILKIEGEVTDESPVIHVSPMDFSAPHAVLGKNFLNYLAAACDVTDRQMCEVFATERAGQQTLIPFFKANFQHRRLFKQSRLDKLASLLKFLDLNE